jgi:hypothetical protein
MFTRFTDLSLIPNGCASFGVHSVFTRQSKVLSPPLAGGDGGEGEDFPHLTLTLALSRQGRGKRYNALFHSTLKDHELVHMNWFT